MEPNHALLLSLRRSMPRELDAQLRRIIREVVDDIRRRLESDIRRVLVDVPGRTYPDRG